MREHKDLASGKSGNKLPALSALARRAGLDGFILALAGMILLAYLWPKVGDKQSPYHLSEVANYGVSLIFLFYGLRLSPEKLKAGLTQWRLHLVVQFATFMLFPLLVLSGKYLFQHDETSFLWLGIFFLAALPSTVSSSVVMVSIAGGNMPAAIFNASISSFIGVFMTPFWMGLILKTETGGFHPGTVILKLALQVLLPVFIGIMLHARWGSVAEKYRRQLRYFDQSIILLIVYTSFCESFVRHMFKGFGGMDIAVLGACMAGLFFLVYWLVKGLSRLLRFNREDTITAVFCGSKKSLVHGTVMSKVLFSGSEVVGVVLLPLMLYHALQLILASIIAQSMAREERS